MDNRPNPARMASNPWKISQMLRQTETDLAQGTAHAILELRRNSSGGCRLSGVLPLKSGFVSCLIKPEPETFQSGVHRMKHALALLMLSAVSALSIGAAYACNHDILCPVKWVWSDGEGTCIEDTKETS